MQVIPTTGLKKDFGEAEEMIRQVKDFSRWIQVDVSDGEFTEGKTFFLELLNKLDFPSEEILWDIHLMVKEPINWLEKCLAVGASRIIGQTEMMSDREEFVRKIKDEGLEAGLAFDIDSELEEIPNETDLVLIMGRKAGFEHYDFEEKILKKIIKAKEKGFKVAVDGAVDTNNIREIETAGGEIVYSETNYWDLIKKQ